MSRDDDYPDQQNEAGEPWPYGDLADAAAEHLYGLWQLGQAETASAVPAAVVLCGKLVSGDGQGGEHSQRV